MSHNEADDHQSHDTGESDQPEVVVLDMRPKVAYGKLPWGLWVLEKLGICWHLPRSFR